MVGRGERDPDAGARSCVGACVRGSREPTSVPFVVDAVVFVAALVVDVVAALVAAVVAGPVCVQVPARDARRRVCAGSLPCGRCCHRASS